MLDISTKIVELEYNKTYKYLGIDEANGINHKWKKRWEKKSIRAKQQY